jgi:hypothetical protein
VYQECTNKSYGPGVGLMAGITEKRQANESTTNQGTAKKQKTCGCGSTTHQRTTNRECSLNKLASKPTLIPPTLAMATMALPPPQALATETLPPTTPAILTTASQAMAPPTTVAPKETQATAWPTMVLPQTNGTEAMVMPIPIAPVRAPLKGTLVMAMPIPLAVPPPLKGTQARAPLPPPQTKGTYAMARATSS